MNLTEPTTLLSLIIGVWAGLIITTGRQMIQIMRLENRVDDLESRLGIHRQDKHREPRRPRQRRQPPVDAPADGS